MSLVPFAVRVSTTRALQAALPGNIVVVDSPQEPLDHLDRDAPQPVVAVYTGTTVSHLDGRNMLGGSPAILLTLQIYLPEQFAFEFGEAGVIRIDTRRQGAETALDVIWRAGLVALNNSPEAWAVLFREFVPTIATISNRHYLLDRNGVRVTAREVSIECEPIHEPIPGADPSDAWAALIAQMQADDKADGLSLLADWVEDSIRGAPLTQDKRDAAYIGLSDYVAQSIGVEPLVEDIAAPGTLVLEVVPDPPVETPAP